MFKNVDKTTDRIVINILHMLAPSKAKNKYWHGIAKKIDINDENFFFIK